jgi:hypothetical protein
LHESPVPKFSGAGAASTSRADRLRRRGAGSGSTSGSDPKVNTSNGASTGSDPKAKITNNVTRKAKTSTSMKVRRQSRRVYGAYIYLLEEVKKLENYIKSVKETENK